MRRNNRDWGNQHKPIYDDYSRDRMAPWEYNPRDDRRSHHSPAPHWNDNGRQFRSSRRRYSRDEEDEVSRYSRKRPFNNDRPTNQSISDCDFKFTFTSEELEHAIPIERWRRTETHWDEKPPGYENVSTDQAKMSGTFPLPGAPKDSTQQDRQKIVTFAKQTEKPNLSIIPLDSYNSRQNRRVNVRNVPVEFAEELQLWLNDLVANFNIYTGNLPITNIYWNTNKTLGIIDCNTLEDATMMLALDGIEFHGRILSIERAANYIRPDFSNTSDNNPYPDSNDKLLIKNLLPNINEDQLRELMSPFGELEYLCLVKDKFNSASKCFAFAKFTSLRSTNLAIEGLNGMYFEKKEMIVQLACPKDTEQPFFCNKHEPTYGGITHVLYIIDKKVPEISPSCVIVILNAITADDLQHSGDHEKIQKEFNHICNQFGEVDEIIIPRPSRGSKINYGVGKVFVKFRSRSGAEEAMQKLTGLKFSDKSIVVAYFPEENFLCRAW